LQVDQVLQSNLNKYMSMFVLQYFGNRFENTTVLIDEFFRMTYQQTSV